MGANYDNTSRHPYRPLADCDSMGRHVGPVPTRARIRRRHGGGAAAPRRPALAAPALAHPPDGWASLAQAVRLPSMLWSIVLGLWIAIAIAGETERMSRRLSQQLGLVLEVAIILSVTITVAGVVSTLIEHASERRALGGPVTGLGQAVARGVVFAVGLLVLLDALGIQITPILTALGVGGLALALALQDTVSNLFAGAHLLADKPIRVGDYVKIADTVEGYVVDIGWRSTRVRMLQNTVVVVPNKKVAESVITNYDLPEPRL